MSGLIRIQTVCTLMVFLKDFFETVNLKKKSRRQKSMQNYPACKELIFILSPYIFLTDSKILTMPNGLLFYSVISAVQLQDEFRL